MPRVVLAMSGGVDSSVAAHLLLKDGYDVVGVFMRHGEASSDACRKDDVSTSPLLPVLQGRPDHKQGCCSASDAADARRVADRLSIPFYAIDMQADFRRIVDYFVDEYQRGRTPNPCVQCNNWIKFGRLFDYADAVDAQYVATGHYARIEYTGDSDSPLGLYRGIDDDKDQAYVLAGIDKSYLPRMLLPVGSYRKPVIRAMAAEVGLRVADKKDSQEICFVTSGKHGEFVRSRSNLDTSGEFVTTDGRVVGKHSGIEQFTIGQRKGLGIAMGEPYFVVRIDPATQRVIIGRKEELNCHWLIAEDMNWLCKPDLSYLDESDRMNQQKFAVQIRYNSPPQAASVQLLEGNRVRVEFAEPCQGIAAGQLAVVFQDNRVLGGGWIRETGV